MSNNDWIFLGSDVIEQINRERKDVIGGINAKVRLSPYDVPIAIRVRRADVEDKLILDFQYILPDEPTARVWVEDHVSVECGKNSQRVYSITIDDALASGRRSPQIESAFERALTNFAKRKKDSPKLGSYQAAKEAISLTWKKIFPVSSSLEPQSSF